ncbi:hypothetical protein Tco_0629018 [Tanacetum coccineum]|uniref:Uncharacterized protein n=1 Tax=Tanacetum coccineum TaxID=301880 RepID=A0ABQ4WS03_9ASTR
MDDLNITIEEYIRLEEEKAQKRGKVFNWENAKYGKIWYDEDIHDLRSVETEFPAIAFNDVVSSKTLSCKPTVSSPNDEIFFRISFDDSDDEDYTWVKIDMTLPPRNQRHQYLRYEGLQYTDADILDFESRLTRVYRREVHRVQVFNFRGLSDLMAEGLSVRILMEHRDAQGQSVFISLAWRRLFDIRGPLTIGFDAYLAESDPILRFCHRLIACSIAGRSQAPEKVTVTDLFYLRGMDVGSINVPYYWLEILQGLTVIAPALSVIDMAKMVRLQICEQLDDTWAWVAMGPERHSMGLFEGAHLQHSRDAPGRGLARPAPPQHSRTSNSMAHDPPILILCLYLYIYSYRDNKTGSKFSTIVHEYVSEASRDLGSKEISMNIGGEFTNLEILKCWNLETSRRLFNTNS